MSSCRLQLLLVSLATCLYVQLLEVDLFGVFLWCFQPLTSVQLPPAITHPAPEERQWCFPAHLRRGLWWSFSLPLLQTQLGSRYLMVWWVLCGVTMCAAWCHMVSSAPAYRLPGCACLQVADLGREPSLQQAAMGPFSSWTSLSIYKLGKS